MKKLLLCICVVFCAHFAWSQSEPIVSVDNLTITHEHKGWRVLSASTSPVHFNFIKGDLIVRIDGRNAGDTGPMIMASLLNEGTTNAIHAFIERGDLRLQINVRQIAAADYESYGVNPFRHVASGFSAPDVDFRDIDGQSHTFNQFRDKWLLIDFMATWCAPCQQTLRQTLEIAGRNHLGLLMVAINDKADSVRRMKKSYDIQAPIVMTAATSPLPIDFGIMTNRWYGQVPGLVLLRPDGEVALIEIGSDDFDHLESAIQRLTAGKAEEAAK